jgi:UDP-N-acetylmuramoyl-tripeptide--D-alanyl-D-alanine ligase
MTSLRNPAAWLLKFAKMALIVTKRTYPYEIIVTEWGIDQIGQMQEYGYVSPDVLVISAISEEHMERFGNIDTVAKEELLAAKFAKQILVNIDAVDQKYLKGLPTYQTYGVGQIEPLQIKSTEKWLDNLKIEHSVIGEHIRLALTAGLAVTAMLKLQTHATIGGVASFKPFKGRMRRLDGLGGCLIVDDTYNSTPIAAEAGLTTMYGLALKRKIAVLGSMNELGDYAEEAHVRVGKFCDPKKLELVITVGEMANKWLAPAAEESGCKVKSFDSPYAAGLFLKTLGVGEDTVVYAKGSQNRIFTEEAIRQILAKSHDRDQLVRQESGWLEIKKSQFTDYID